MKNMQLSIAILFFSLLLSGSEQVYPDIRKICNPFSSGQVNYLSGCIEKAIADTDFNDISRDNFYQIEKYGKHSVIPNSSNLYHPGFTILPFKNELLPYFLDLPPPGYL